MKFGYMAGFRADLCSEIEFTKKHFDFIEITILPELLKTIDNVFYNIKDSLDVFKVLGHIHWEIIDFDDIKKNVKILRELGAKKITIHPFQDLNIEENARILNWLNGFLKTNGMELLVENISSLPYGSAKRMMELLEKIPGVGLTLDVGHANRNSELDRFIDNFNSNIKHIHLHYNLGDFDHLFYDKEGELNKIFFKINSFDYNGTILLETFSVMNDNKNVSQEFSEIKKLHIEQLKMKRGRFIFKQGIRRFRELWEKWGQGKMESGLIFNKKLNPPSLKLRKDKEIN